MAATLSLLNGWRLPAQHVVATLDAGGALAAAGAVAAHDRQHVVERLQSIFTGQWFWPAWRNRVGRSRGFRRFFRADGFFVGAAGLAENLISLAMRTSLPDVAPSSRTGWLGRRLWTRPARR